jgi:hypothetical protein
MRIIEKTEIDKLVSLLTRIRKEYVTPFKPSRLYPPYYFWNRSGTEQSKMYPTLYVTPKLLEEAQQMANAEVSL